MLKNIAIAAAALAGVATPSVALAASLGYQLKLVVPVHCSVNLSGVSPTPAVGDGYSLGTFREYCNAPQGYSLIVRYAPGSLEGAQIVAAGKVVILDGSGVATLGREAGPRVRSRAVSITPGAGGFDTGHLELDVVPN